MKKIFIVERPDGSVWADYSEDYARRFKVVKVIEIDTRSQMEAVINDGGQPPRVRALADRALSEFLQRGQQPEPPPVRGVAAATAAVAKRSLFSRVAGWFAGGR